MNLRLVGGLLMVLGPVLVGLSVAVESAAERRQGTVGLLGVAVAALGIALLLRDNRTPPAA